MDRNRPSRRHRPVVGVQKQTSDGEAVYFEGNEVEEGQMVKWSTDGCEHHTGVLTKESRLEQAQYHLHKSQEKLTPRETVSVEVEVLLSSTLFEEGDKLVVVVQGVDTVESGLEPDSISSGSVKILTSATHPSQLVYQSAD